ncbi:hypothetical protein BJ944DRAFT_274021 [Cunninghamella echinulata]|nr:hypothetical protein BJ944DRAFT_274021 [Cunninghamella echinulata]
MVQLTNSLFIASLATVFTGIHAHVSFTNDTAKPNTVLNTALAVPHGCSGSDTIGIQVTAPENIDIGIKPLQVQNWTLQINYRDSQNKSVKDFSWTGGYIGSTARQEFGVELTIPQVDLSQKPNVTALFPTVQTCLNGTSNWTSDPSAPGYNSTKDKPSPEIVITNQEPSHSDHDGHDHSTGKDTSGAMSTLGQPINVVLAALLGAAVVLA